MKVICIKNIYKHPMYDISEPNLIIGKIYTITHSDFNKISEESMVWITEINSWVPIEFIADLKEYREEQLNKILNGITQN